MRTGSLFLTTLMLPALAAVASAQSRGATDVGVRLGDVSGDETRLQRFRDISDGVVMERFRFEHEGDRWFFSLRGDHAGRRDQRYAVEYLHGGRLAVSFAWDQVPQLISGDTRTLFVAQAPGIFRLDPAIQQALQANPAQLPGFAPAALGVDVRSRRDIAAFALAYAATRDVDVTVNVRTTRRDGTMPWAVTFGHSNVVELPAPIDTRTTDVAAGVEWTNARRSLRIGYDGSLFSNYVPALVWDNPWRLTDSPTAGSSQGRAALPPGSSLHAVTAVGGLPLAARSRVTGSVTLGTWRQNDQLLPFTINSTIAAPQLPRPSAEAAARTVAMNYTVTSRPVRMVWLNARYRYHEFDNRTPPFEVPTRVRLDQTVIATHGPETLSSTRHNLDLDASLRPLPFTSFSVAYGRAQADRTHRIFGRTTENVVRASADTALARIVTVRGIFEHAERAGSRFDEQALPAVGEQPAMRHFDVADRDRNRVTAMVQVTPVPAVGLSASVARGRDDYRNSGFGLRDSETTSYSVALDLVPDERINAGLSFVSDTYSTLQRSRNAAPGAQFVDPTRDWMMDANDRTRTITAGLDLLRVVPATELRLAYDTSRSRATYLYLLPPDSTLASPSQLPPVLNRLQRATVDLRYFIAPRLAIGTLYWFDDYHVEDFSLGPDTVTRIDIGSNLYLGYLYRPYTAHVASLRLIYFW
jgi:MtrB/PioB family decaheme-associated outer membrane protein